MDKNTSFYFDFIKYLKTHFNDSVILFSEGTTLKKRYAYEVESLTVELINNVSNLLGNSVFFVLCDSAKYLEKIKKALKKKIEDEEVDVSKLPESDIELLKKEQLISIANEYNTFGESVKKVDVNKRPWLFVDIDLADQLQLLKEKKLIPENINDRTELKTFLLNLNGKIKKDMVLNILNMDVIYSETSPNLLLFSGNGIHIWYSIPIDEKINYIKYEKIYMNFIEKFKPLIPGINIDESCKSINRNMRLPFTLNKKGVNPVLVEILYVTDFNSISNFMKDIITISEIEKPIIEKYHNTEYKSGNFFDIIFEKAENKSIYNGLLDIQKDYRLLDFVSSHLTFSSILEYVMEPLRNMSITSDDGQYCRCSSPFREDKNPSFAYKDSTLLCHDFSTGEQYDYGILMKKLLDFKKEKLGLYELLPTTSLEAQFHCVFCSYLLYMKTSKLQNPPFPFMKKDSEDFMDDSSQSKLLIPGSAYYNNLIAKMKEINDCIRFKYNKTKSTEDTFKYLLSIIPRVYYFYQFSKGVKEAISTSLPELNRLTILSLFDEQKFCVTLNRNKDGKIIGLNFYIRNISGEHILFKYGYKYNVTGEYKKQHVNSLGNHLVQINMQGAPKMQTKSSSFFGEAAYTICFKLNDMEKELSQIISHKNIYKEEEIKYEIINYINKEFKIDIKEYELDIPILSNNKYILFKNGFVKYDAPESELNTIGEFIPRTEETKYILMRKHLCDIALPHEYEVEKKETPKFDMLLNFLDHEGNNAKKILRYFFGSCLYNPDGANSRAVILFGPHGKNGKSALADVIRKAFTSKYISEKDIHDISQDSESGKRERMSLQNKLINISSDSSGEKLETKFKNMVTGDPVTMRDLYKRSEEYPLRTHFLINVNRMLQMKSESLSFNRRVLTIKLYRVVETGKEIPDLADQIIKEEIESIWNWIIQQAKIFREKGLFGFLEPKELEDNEDILLQQNDLYSFIDNYVKFDKDWQKNKTHITKTDFKRLYNKYRRQMDRFPVNTEDLLHEAETIIANKFKGLLPDNVFAKGFSYKNEQGLRGLPGIYILIPGNEIGYHRDLDSRNLD